MPLSSPPMFLSRSASAPLILNASINTEPLLQQQQNALAIFARRSSHVAPSTTTNVVTPTTSLSSSLSPVTTKTSSSSMAGLLTSSASSNNVIPISFVADFLHRLLKMLRDGNEQFIEWSDGKLHIHDPTKLASEILPKYYRHSKYSSFQRQLNYFGFRKISGKGKMSACVYSNDGTTTDVFSILSLKRKPSFPSNKSMNSLKNAKQSNKSLNNVEQGITTTTNAPLLKKKHNCVNTTVATTTFHSQGGVKNHNFEFPIVQQNNQNPMMTMTTNHQHNPFDNIFSRSGNSSNTTNSAAPSMPLQPQQNNFIIPQGTLSNSQGLVPKQEQQKNNVISNNKYVVNNPLKRCVSTSPSNEDDNNCIPGITFHMPIPLMLNELPQQQQQSNITPFNNQQSFAPNPINMNNQQQQQTYNTNFAPLQQPPQPNHHFSNDGMSNMQTIFNQQQTQQQQNIDNTNSNANINYNDMIINDPTTALSTASSPELSFNDLDINTNTMNLSNSEFIDVLNSLANPSDDVIDDFETDLFSIDNNENTTATTFSSTTTTATNYFDKVKDEYENNIVIQPYPTIG